MDTANNTQIMDTAHDTEIMDTAEWRVSGKFLLHTRGLCLHLD